MTRLLLASIFAVALLGCQGKQPAPTPASSLTQIDSSLPSPERFAEQFPSFERYWHQGKAELTRYTLRQARYGDTHDGEAVLVFVTEDFLPKLQVKKEQGEASDALTVLKLNAYRRFYTGIYPYTVMTSSFTPESGAPTLKLSSTVQEWCGQVYSQVNRRDDGLHSLMHSYFQNEADQKSVLPKASLEDGLWAQVRIDPTTIELGSRELVPALAYIRMRHKALRPYPAVLTKTEGAATDLVDHPVTALRVDYPPLGRTLVIYYEPEFPHVIQAWEETEGPFRTTAVRTHAIIDDYWNHNSAEDGAYREALGLQY
jgi:hypothetical protein